MTRIFPFFLFGLVALGSIGCGDDPSGPVDAGYDAGRDAGFDAGLDAGAFIVLPGDWLYWTENRSLNRRELTGGDSEFVGVVSDLRAPVGMFFEEATRTLWIGDNITPPHLGTLSPDDASIEWVLELEAPLLDMAVIEGHLAYIVLGTGAPGLYRVDLSAEEPALVELGEFSDLMHLTATDDALYLSNALAGTVTRTDLDGENASTLALPTGTAGGTIGDIVVDGDLLYAIVNRSGGGAEQTLERYALGEDEAGEITLAERFVVFREQPNTIESFMIDGARFKLYLVACDSDQNCQLRVSRPDGQGSSVVASFDGTGTLGSGVAVVLDPGNR